MVPLAETVSLELVPIRAALSRTTKVTWRDNRVSDPTLRMAQQVRREAMGLHLQRESDGAPQGEIYSALDWEFHQKYYVSAQNICNFSKACMENECFDTRIRLLEQTPAIKYSIKHHHSQKALQAARRTHTPAQQRLSV